MDKKTYRILTELLSYKLSGATKCTEELSSVHFTDELLKELYFVSSAHDLAHIVGSALISLNVNENEKIADVFYEKIALAVSRCERICHTIDVIKTTLNSEKIPFIPLKGAVLRKFYPETFYRTSCDADILVKPCDAERASKVIAEKLKAEKVSKHYHDYGIITESGENVELHFSLDENTDCYDKFTAKAWDYAVKEQDESFEYKFTDEFFITYFLIHMAYHFSSGGCGIRPFIDLWLMNKRLTPNREKLSAMLNECRLKKFAEKAFALSNVWFSEGVHDEITVEMEDFIMNGGVYGTREQNVTMSIVKKGGRFKYFIGRIFMPLKSLATVYPVLNKAPYLLPIFWVVRWVRAIFGKSAFKAIGEIKINKQLTEEKRRKIEELCKELEINI